MNIKINQMYKIHNCASFFLLCSTHFFQSGEGEGVETPNRSGPANALYVHSHSSIFCGDSALTL